MLLFRTTVSLVMLSFLFFKNGLAQIAENKCKFLGNIIANTTPTDFTNLWNQVSPENAGKWGSVEGTRDVMNWTALDNAYQTAKSNGFPFKQHTLVWGQQQPTWMDGLSASEQKEEVEEWIKLFCERYPDTDFIDVVNEPLHAVPTYSNAIGGPGLNGWEWVAWVFEKTRQYCPNAKLFLNDYNIVNSNGATTSYLQIINLLKGRNLIDGIGEQGHFLETTPISTIKANLDRLGETGLPIHISEFDISIADDAAQKARYEELFPVLWNHDAVQGITLWGYKQGQIWRENAYLIRSNGSERPALGWLKTFVASSGGGGFCVNVGTEDDVAASFQASPNPVVDGNIAIAVPANCNLEIYSATGTRVNYRKSLSSGTHQLQFQFPSGMYLLRFSNQESVVVKKIVVQ